MGKILTPAKPKRPELSVAGLGLFFCHALAATRSTIPVMTHRDRLASTTIAKVR
ncbi:MAG: hypothetical protein AAB214_11640 [Fibrobacterota bacterium]